MPGSDTAASNLLPVVGLGASAGGLSALQDFFGHLPGGLGFAYVVIVHLSPDRDSNMAALLQRVTALPVTEVVESVGLEPDHVYVIPPDQNLSCTHDRLELTPRETSGPRQAPIDLFFRTLAETHGPRAVGGVLSGTGSDGTEGLRQIRTAGGIAVAQDPDDAEHPQMPRSAIRTGVVDRVLPARELGLELQRLADAGLQVERVEVPDTPDAGAEGSLRRILYTVRGHTGHDFSSYKRTTILRRVRRRMRFSGASSLEQYHEVLRESPEEVEALDEDLLILVSRFFRDPDSFEAVEKDVIPAIMANGGPGREVRVWVAGCATGEEAYTLAMLFHEHAESLDDPPSVQIFATDLSESACAIARRGRYPKGIAADLTPERLSRHFIRDGEEFRVQPHLKEKVLVARHDLLHDPPFGNMDLISCRNVLIYMDRELQRRVPHLLHYALRPGGHLLLGRSESVEPAGDLFRVVNKRHRIFRAESVSGHHAPLVMPIARASPPEATPEARSPSLWTREGGAPEVGAIHHRLVELYAPPSVLVDRNREVVHLSHGAGRYLHPSGGLPSRHVLDMVEGELKAALGMLLHSAFRDGRAREGTTHWAGPDGEEITVRLSVRPLRETEAEIRHALVVFDERRREGAGGAGEPSTDASGTAAEALPGDTGEARIEQELRRTRAQLRAMAEDHDRAIQEHQAANEELQSINEEQRATAEELETSREELHAVNEELHALNQEYRSKIDELEEVNADLANLINSTDIGTIFLDRTLSVRRFTPRVTEVFNFVAADLGRQVGDVTHRLDYPDLKSDVGRVLETLEKVDRTVRSEDGRWFLIRISPYRTTQDRIAGVVLTLVDVTERKRIEEEREELFERARDASEAKSHLLGVISHEFRTPLSGVLGHTELLEREMEGKVPDRVGERARRLRGAVQQLMEMIDEILEHASLENQSGPVEVSDVDPETAARAALTALDYRAQAQGLELRAEVPSSLPPFRTDHAKLVRILVNLVSNAVKFTTKGHVMLRVHSDEDRMVFEVEDTGTGIDPADQERIFEPFYQVRGRGEGAEAGTGLGLSVVRDLVHLLEGDVLVVSEPGRGSRFTVRLPLVPVEELSESSETR